ncbi:MAG TPA: DUF4870 domain-containing protein [Symbiobacteriaceae bacterium]|jgi:hypothetical protein
MALLAHLLSLFFGFIPPLVVYLVKKDQSAFAGEHAKEALNFQLSMIIYYLGAGILVILLVGILLLPLLYIFSLIFIIIATIKAANGEMYRYPLTIRFIS